MKYIKRNTGGDSVRIVGMQAIGVPQRQDFAAITARHVRASVIAERVVPILGAWWRPLRDILPERVASLSEVRDNLARILDSRLLDDIGVTPGGFRRF